MRSILIALSLLIAAPAWAQGADSELWLTAAGEIAIGERTSLEADSISRFSDDSGGLYEVEMSAGAKRQLGGGWWVGGGFVRVVNYARGTVTRTENRVRVQAGLSTGAGPFKLSGRLRLERRTASTGDQIGYRLRPNVKATLPLGQSGLHLFASHESFIVVKDTESGDNTGHERMRNSVGLSLKASKAINVEAGYLHQYRLPRNGRASATDHALTLTLAVSL